MDVHVICNASTSTLLPFPTGAPPSALPQSQRLAGSSVTRRSVAVSSHISASALVASVIAPLHSARGLAQRVTSTAFPGFQPLQPAQPICAVGLHLKDLTLIDSCFKTSGGSCWPAGCREAPTQQHSSQKPAEQTISNMTALCHRRPQPAGLLVLWALQAAIVLTVAAPAQASSLQHDQSGSAALLDGLDSATAGANSLRLLDRLLQQQQQQNEAVR